MAKGVLAMVGQGHSPATTRLSPGLAGSSSAESRVLGKGRRVRAQQTPVHFRLLPSMAKLLPVLLSQEGLWGTPAAHRPGSWHRGQAGPLAAPLERVEGGEAGCGCTEPTAGSERTLWGVPTAFTQLGQRRWLSWKKLLNHQQ